MRRIELPLTDAVARELTAGCEVELCGVLYGARDQAHKRLVAALDEGRQLPVPLQDQTIYYVGPAPTPGGRVIGSCGPTTASRMDRYAPRLLAAGLRGMIGKGPRSEAVCDAIMKYRAVYFYAFGGCGAMYAQRVTACELVAFADLGPEAIYKLTVENFPAIVAIDSHGNSLFSS